MSKSRRASQVARRDYPQPLGHTATTARRPLLDWAKPISTRTLMRTVLDDRSSRSRSSSFPSLQTRFPSQRSPAVVVRASGRSSQRAARSPFLNATFYSPGLTERSMVCARRHIRKEVLFALKRTNGKGSRGRRSKVRC